MVTMKRTKGGAAAAGGSVSVLGDVAAARRRASLRPQRGVIPCCLAALLVAGCSMQPAAPEVTLATVADGGATHPTVAIDPTRGAVYVAWVGTPDADGRSSRRTMAVVEAALESAETNRIVDVRHR